MINPPTTSAEVQALAFEWATPILGYLGFIAVMLLALALMREITR